MGALPYVYTFRGVWGFDFAGTGGKGPPGLESPHRYVAVAQKSLPKFVPTEASRS